jgi:hypothetical protein
MPSLRAEAATSQPMKPAPMTASFGLGASARCSASASSRSRRVCRPPSSWPGPVHGLAAFQVHPLGGRVQRGRALAQAPRHVDLVGREHAGVDVVDPGEQVLGQRRAGVRAVPLGADDRQLALVARGARGLRRPQAGERGTDDDQAARHEVNPRG